MDNSLTQIFSDKIDKLTYKLYKTEQKILNMEALARQRWENIYEHHSYSKDYKYIKYNGIKIILKIIGLPELLFVTWI